jgi:hypothetical protein
MGYGIDGWWSGGQDLTVTPTPEGLAMSGGTTGGALYQRIEDGIEGYKGRTVTLSVFIGGKAYSCTGVVPSGAFSPTVIFAIYGFAGGNIHAFTNIVEGVEIINVAVGVDVGSSFTVKYAKFELGDVATPLVPEDRSLSLTRCKRLLEYVIKNPSGTYDYLSDGATYYRNDSPSPGLFKVGALIKFTVEKRIPPILLYGGTFRVICAAYAGGDVNAVLAADTVELVYGSKTKAYINFYGTGTIPEGTTHLQIDTFENDGWLAFDASN